MYCLSNNHCWKTKIDQIKLELSVPFLWSVQILLICSKFNKPDFSIFFLQSKFSDQSSKGLRSQLPIGIENPAINTKKFSSKEEAKKYFEKKIKEKTSKGYQEH